MIDAVEKLGGSIEQTGAASNLSPGGGFELWPEHADAVRLFSASQTQWRRAGMSGRPSGLDYAGVAVVARMIGLKLKPDLFDELQVMEVAYIDEAAKLLAKDMD